MTKKASVGRIGQRACDYILEDDASINDLLAVAAVTLEKGETLSIDGDVVKGKDDFNDGDTVVIAPSTSGA